MPYSFTDQFFVMDPYNPPPPGSLLTVQTFVVTDQNDDGDVDRSNRDSIDGVDIRAAYNGDTITIVTLGGQTVTVTGATFYLADGRQVFTPTDGSNLQDGALVSTSWVSGQSSVTIPQFGPPPCFVPGTLIATADGQRPVDRLGAGDLILTADRGALPALFVRRRELTLHELRAHPRRGPVRIAAGALGDGLPQRDLVVSPQHRMVLRSRTVERMFAVPEIMAPACQLVGRPGITQDPVTAPVIYVHILLDEHAVIYAEGAPTESLFLGDMAAADMSGRDRQILRARLGSETPEPTDPARPFLRGARLRQLLFRLDKNAKPLVEPAAETADEQKRAA